MEMTRARYKQLNVILSSLIVAANGFGALLVTLYFVVIDPLPEGNKALTAFKNPSQAAVSLERVDRRVWNLFALAPA